MKRLTFILISLLTIAVVSCKKDKPEPDDDTQSVQDYTKSQDAFQSDFKVVNDYGINEEGIKNLTSDTIQVTVTPLYPLDSFPKTLTVNFGTNGVLCNDGRTRKGIINAVFSDHWHWHYDSCNVGTNVTITFSNYYVKDYIFNTWVKREGTLRVTYQGKNTDNGPMYKHEAINAKLIFEDNTNIFWNATTYLSWTVGWNTPLNRTDDISWVYGHNEGTNRHGETYVADVSASTPLKFDMTCTLIGSITQGVYSLTPQNLATRTVDFGDGTCDRIAVCTINGVPYSFNF